MGIVRALVGLITTINQIKVLSMIHSIIRWLRSISRGGRIVRRGV